MLTIEEIITILKNAYGEITDRGCCVNGRWLSLEQIVELLKANA